MKQLKIKRGQAIMMDLFVAFFVFLILMVLIIAYWNLYTIRLNENLGYEEMQLTAFQITDLLVKGKGRPGNWEENNSNVEIIGLANSDRNLSTEKVGSFIDINYNRTREIMYMQNYGFYFGIDMINGTNLVSYGEENATGYAVSLRRYVLYENEKAILLFKLWR